MVGEEGHQTKGELFAGINIDIGANIKAASDTVNTIPHEKKQRKVIIHQGERYRTCVLISRRPNRNSSAERW
jgi:hypothetical protein